MMIIFLIRKSVSKMFFWTSISLYLIAEFLDTLGVMILTGCSWKTSKKIVFDETKRVYNSVK